jgi:hypothetical protein
MNKGLCTLEEGKVLFSFNRTFMWVNSGDHHNLWEVSTVKALPQKARGNRLRAEAPLEFCCR